VVKSELYRLEQLVGEIVKNEADSVNASQATGRPEQVRSIASACASLKGIWAHELFSNVKEPVLTRYVQYHQAGITSLYNQVSARIPDIFFQGLENSLNQPYFGIVTDLEDLIQFLKQGFYRYFDYNYPVSTELCRAKSKEILALLSEIKITFKKSAVDVTLIHALTVSIENKLADARQSGINYRQLEYCQVLLTTISQQFRDQTGLNTISLAHQLYRQNFNSYYFNQWYQEYLGSIISGKTESKKQAAIANEIKLLRSNFVAQDKIFESALSPINNQLLDWLQLLLTGQTDSALKEVLKMNGHERMPLQFSVTQFALFIRLCYLEACFPIHNISDILRFFTQHFETKKQLNISFKSFARAFYGADQATAAVVRNFLQRMINTINKTYFPRS